MDDPGANKERNEATLEKLEITSALVVDPTLIALEMHAGYERESLNALFPEAITVAMPTETRLSMANLRESPSQLLKDCPPPRLILIEAIVTLEL